MPARVEQYQAAVGDAAGSRRFQHLKEYWMTQFELYEAVSRATGETVSMVGKVGFHLADPLDVHFDPEPRPPLVFDWDRMAPVDWPA
jgi:hypothetical protein